MLLFKTLESITFTRLSGIKKEIKYVPNVQEQTSCYLKVNKQYIT